MLETKNTRSELNVNKNCFENEIPKHKIDVE